MHREAAGLPATVGGEAGDKLHFHWLKGLFEDACAALSGGLDALCAFIGIKVGGPPWSPAAVLLEPAGLRCHLPIEHTEASIRAGAIN